MRDRINFAFKNARQIFSVHFGQTKYITVDSRQMHYLEPPLTAK